MVPGIFEYTAKFICGLQRDRDDLRLAKGLYATEVNLHNPNDQVVQVTQKKLVLTFPPGEQRPGEVLLLEPHDLEPDQAVGVDCVHVREKLFGGNFPTPYIIGFLVVQATASLDITAVYTTGALDEQDQLTGPPGIHVEQIRERQRTAGPDLADLVPLPGERGFCEDNRVSFIVRNQGTARAGSSTTIVDFGQYGRVSLSTLALQPGQQIPFQVALPPGCLDPDCEFTITVNADNQVAESDRNNNIAQGVCQG
jgi:CARDB